VDGGVAFRGDADIMMKANLHSRTASRVLLKLAEGGYQQESDIYQLAMQIDWPRWFDVSRSIKVKTDAIGAQLRSLDFVSLKVKDAVCDRFRQANAGRPNVDTRTPDMRIHTFLTRDHATIYLDTSGEPLFKRGWREETGEAPLRENLAAGILLIAGYDGSQPLLDPMCGSGTFLVEAADIALKRAPGRNRRFGFQRLREFDALSWEALLSEARAAELPVRNLAIKAATAPATCCRWPAPTCNAPAWPMPSSCKHRTSWKRARLPTAALSSPTRLMACAWTSRTRWPSCTRSWATG
jgi:putative N6-adenine-specific DNA methylase